LATAAENLAAQLLNGGEDVVSSRCQLRPLLCGDENQFLQRQCVGHDFCGNDPAIDGVQLHRGRDVEQRCQIGRGHQHLLLGLQDDLIAHRQLAGCPVGISVPAGPASSMRRRQIGNFLGQLLVLDGDAAKRLGADQLHVSGGYSQQHLVAHGNIFSSLGAQVVAHGQQIEDVVGEV